MQRPAVHPPSLNIKHIEPDFGSVAEMKRDQHACRGGIGLRRPGQANSRQCAYAHGSAQVQIARPYAHEVEMKQHSRGIQGEGARRRRRLTPGLSATSKPGAGAY